ncbi:MAG: dual specificity protein phosphatase family protein [Actinomycetota bacterium]|nr:dual specificity protein phosphatase family protein [Actinomycetota bacterium]
MELTAMGASPAYALPQSLPFGVTLRKASIAGVAAVVVVLLVGNLVILGLHLLARQTVSAGTVTLPGIENFRVVDDKLWRGSHPSRSDYSLLADRGVKTIVDLRAETGLDVPRRLLDRLGVTLVSIPIRDGQAPTQGQVNRFLRVVQNSEGTVYVHCMAGVGRTGAMVAAYLVGMENTSAMSALHANLSVGPPSLEQMAFVAGNIEEPNLLVTGLSRVLDGPRRIWSRVT